MADIRLGQFAGALFVVIGITLCALAVAEICNMVQIPGFITIAPSCALLSMAMVVIGMVELWGGWEP